MLTTRNCLVCLLVFSLLAACRPAPEQQVVLPATEMLYPTLPPEWTHTPPAATQAPPSPAATGPSESLFFDDFAQPDSRWASGDSANVSRSYVAGAYRLKLLTADGVALETPGLDLANVGLEADVRVVSVPSADHSFGLVCRVQDENNYYRFVIGADGYYGISRVVDGERFILAARERQANAALRQGGQVNHLRAACVGDRLALYANGELLLEVVDATYSGGDVGVTARALEAGLEVEFDNFAVDGGGELPPLATPPAEGPLGALVSSDGFGADSPFRTHKYDNGSMTLAGGQYSFSVDQGSMFNTLDTPYADVSLVVELGLVSDSGYAGLLCRVQTADNYYAFMLGSDGALDIRRETPEAPIVLAADVRPDLLTPAGQPNRLRADCVGQELTLSLNGYSLLTVTDDAYDQGLAGVIAGADERDGAQAVFDNYAVYEPVGAGRGAVNP